MFRDHAVVAFNIFYCCLARVYMVSLLDRKVAFLGWLSYLHRFLHCLLCSPRAIVTKFERKQTSCFGVWHISPFLTFSLDFRVCVDGSATGLPQIVFQHMVLLRQSLFEICHRALCLSTLFTGVTRRKGMSLLFSHIHPPTSFPGSFFSASLSRWNRNLLKSI